MQNSELFRQGIVLPLDLEAEQRLRASDVESSTNVRVVMIPTKRVFADICAMKFIDCINASCSALIDEYEEEWIDAEATGKLLLVIDSMCRVAEKSDTIEFLSALRVLVVEAQRMSRPLLFVF